MRSCSAANTGQSGCLGILYQVVGLRVWPRCEFVARDDRYLCWGTLYGSLTRQVPDAEFGSSSSSKDLDYTLRYAIHRQEIQDDTHYRLQHCAARWAQHCFRLSDQDGSHQATHSYKQHVQRLSTSEIRLRM